MRITKCPVCSSIPIIEDFPINPRYKNGIRRRFCRCPNRCSVIPRKDRLNGFGFEFDGPGDDNMIFRQWNKHLEKYEMNRNIHWPEWYYLENTDVI